MLEKSDWRDVFSSWDEPLHIDVDLDVWAAKCPADQTPAKEQEVPQTNVPVDLAALENIRRFKKDDDEDEITRELEEIFHKEVVRFATEDDGVRSRVPTPIFIDGRYTPMFRYPINNDIDRVAMDTDREQKLDSAIINKTKKTSKLGKLFKRIRRFFGRKHL